MDPLLLGIIGLAVALLLTLAILIFYTGLFDGVEVKTGRPPVASIRVAYKFATGPYKDCSYLFTEVISIVPKLRSIGVYYDDPKKVEPDNHRYIVGAILGEGGNSDTDDKDAEALLLSKDFKLASFPAVDHAVTTSFPYIWALSISIATAKVWPKLGEYIEERKLCAHPAIEIYTSDRILYMLPLAKQEDFYVEEAKKPKQEKKQPISDESQEGDVTGDVDSHDTTVSSYSSEGSGSESSFEEVNLQDEELAQAAKED